LIGAHFGWSDERVGQAKGRERLSSDPRWNESAQSALRQSLFSARPMSESYQHVVKGGLKLKGGVPGPGGVKKKKKKDKHEDVSPPRHTSFARRRRAWPLFSLRAHFAFAIV
jgi:hypothetical protein|tara:strand:+ start:3193 stop:3528 length:336 start_codon:yes stop_codon:yes gene_type:complete